MQRLFPIHRFFSVSLDYKARVHGAYVVLHRFRLIFCQVFHVCVSKNVELGFLSLRICQALRLASLWQCSQSVVFVYDKIEHKRSVSCISYLLLLLLLLLVFSLMLLLFVLMYTNFISLSTVCHCFFFLLSVKSKCKI